MTSFKAIKKTISAHLTAPVVLSCSKGGAILFLEKINIFAMDPPTSLLAHNNAFFIPLSQLVIELSRHICEYFSDKSTRLLRLFTYNNK